MIYCTLGNDRRPFARLLERAQWCAEVSGDTEIVVQHGHTPLTLEGAQGFDFLDYDRHRGFLQEASLIVAHAGAGTLIDCLELGKVPLLLPRLQQHGEHKNDHQLEIYRYALDRGIAKACDDDGLRDVMADGRQTKFYDASVLSDYFWGSVRQLLND